MCLIRLNIPTSSKELNATQVKKEGILDQKSTTDNVLDLSDQNTLSDELTAQDLNLVKAVKINNTYVNVSKEELTQIVSKLKAFCLDPNNKLNGNFVADFKDKTGISVYKTDLSLSSIESINKIDKDLDTALSKVLNGGKSVAEIQKFLATSMSSIQKQIDLLKASPDKSKASLQEQITSLEAKKTTLGEQKELLGGIHLKGQVSEVINAGKALKVVDEKTLDTHIAKLDTEISKLESLTVNPPNKSDLIATLKAQKAELQTYKELLPSLKTIQAVDKTIGEVNSAFVKKTDINTLTQATTTQVGTIDAKIAEATGVTGTSEIKEKVLTKLNEQKAWFSSNMEQIKTVLPKVQDVLTNADKINTYVKDNKVSATKMANTIADELPELQESVSVLAESTTDLNPEVNSKVLQTFDKAETALNDGVEAIKLSGAEDAQRLLRKGTTTYAIGVTYDNFKLLVDSGRRKGFDKTPEGFVASAIADVKSDAEFSKKLQDISKYIKAIDPTTANEASTKLEIGNKVDDIFKNKTTGKFFIKESTVQQVKQIYLNQFDLVMAGKQINDIQDLQKIIQLAQGELSKALAPIQNIAIPKFGEAKRDDIIKDRTDKLAPVNTSFNETNQKVLDVNVKTQIAQNRLDKVNDEKIEVEKLGFGVKTTGTLKEQQSENKTIRTDLRAKLAEIVSKNTEIMKTQGDITKKVKIENIKTFIAESLHGFTARAVMNKMFDKNQDGKITLSEMRNMNKEEFKKLAMEAHEWGLESRVDDIALYIDSLKDQDGSMEIINFTANRDYQSYWQFSGDNSTKEINNMVDIDNKNDKHTVEVKDKLKMDILAKADNNPEVKKLLDNLSTKGAFTAVNLQAINKVLDKLSDKKGIQDIAKELNTFLVSTEGKFSSTEKLQIVKDILHDLAYPDDIDQSNKGTCSATATQMKLAIDDPLKYADVCTTLACGKDYAGKDDKVLKPNYTFMGDIYDGRSLSSKIMQNSFMDYAHSLDQNYVMFEGSKIFYDSKISIDGAQGLDKKKDDLKNLKEANPYLKDVDDKTIEKLGGGLFSPQAESLEKALFGNVYNTDEGFFRNYNFYNTNSDIIDDIKKDVKNGKPVPISVQGHAVLVESFDEKGNPPKFIINSWSQKFEITPENLEKVLKSARLRD